MIEVKAICDSINPQDNRLHTQLWRYPKFLHQESLRHRALYIHDCLYDPDFSFSVSSARAIPFAKLLAEVRSDELRAAPEYWGAEQKGMSPGAHLDPACTDMAIASWKEAALSAANNAEEMSQIGVHKSICNRIIEPYIHVNCLTTGTTRGWMNFFGLRLDKAADPTLQVLAQATWKVWNESQPTKLEPRQWHLPFIEDADIDECRLTYVHQLVGYRDPGDNFQLRALQQISVARCARLSFLSFDTNKRSTIEEDLRLYDRLVGSSPIHASPAEHQATPDSLMTWKVIESIGGPSVGSVATENWMNPKEAGNLGPGWRQYRKMLPNESVAALPEGY